MNGLRGAADPIPAVIRMMLRNKGLHGGAQLQPVKDYQGAISETYRRTLLPKTWAPSAVSELYVRRFLDLAEAHGIAVFCHIPPFCEPVRKERAAQGLDLTYDAFTDAMQARYPNLTVIDARNAGYGIDLFCDPAHMNRRGAIAYSGAVARIVATALTQGEHARRIALPQFSPADDGRPEDLVQSWSIVHEADDRIRR